jgi:hypothetical protein
VSTERLIDDLHHGVSATADRFLQWRTAAPPGNAQRDALRAVCPADGSVPPADLEVARALVADPALYRQALRLSDTAVARR